MSPPGLLVSVRSVLEAESALAGGAALIDVKEPANGPLGRAEPSVITAIVEYVADRCPVSAALGEAAEFTGPIPGDVAFVKWGLADRTGRFCWRSFLSEQWNRIQTPQAVAVAYADWQCAHAPPVEDIVDFANEMPGRVLLIDTGCKDAHTLDRTRRPTLLDWLSVQEVESICRRCRAAGVRIALAGSLGLQEIGVLRHCRPDWFAVRGAACMGGRAGTVDRDRVRSLTGLLNGT